jgi:hypothetical protein
MAQAYSLIFWIPALASAVMLLAAGPLGLLTRPGLLVLWFGLALLLQAMAGPFSPLWAVGLVLQVILGIYMAIQIKLATC